MSDHIVFVTTEFEPVTAGGAGAVVAGIADALSNDGHRVTVLLIAVDPVKSNDSRVTVVPVERDAVATEGRPLSSSKAAYSALLVLLDGVPASAIEFQDFDGLGFWTLTHRSGTALTTTPIGIRYHLPADHILDEVGSPRADFAVTRILERQALACADFVISQTESMRPVIAERYGVPDNRIIIGPPPVPPVERVDPKPSVEPRFAVVGRLSEQKGVHDLLDDVSDTLTRHPEMSIEFIGSDGWSATHDRPMREWLPELLPDSVRGQVVFRDAIARDELPGYLSDFWAVIVPSRLESYCLVAHEVRSMGLPLIVRNEPAIVEHFSDGRGAIVYDRAGSGVDTVLENVLADRSMLESVVAAGAAPNTDPVVVYQNIPEPRHLQSQAGLATAALYTLEAATSDDGSTTGGLARAAASLLRKLPDPVARAAIVVVPDRLKDRFRSVASWPEEQEKRSYASRLDAVRTAITSGGFGDVSDPRVSVIIPCFNQGHLVEAAILSVFEQTNNSWEVVVINDGSTDPVTIDALASIDLPRVRVIDQENRGLPGARNTGIRASRGEFFVPLDADDELLPSYVDSLIEVFDTDETLAFVHCWAELFGDVNWVWATRPYNPFVELLSNGVLQTAMVRRGAWDSVGGYDETLTSGNEDWDMWLRFQEAGWNNQQVRQPLYRYRKEGISMSVTNEAAFEEGRQRMIDRHPELYNREAIQSVKRRHYPLLSVILEAPIRPTGLELDDVELVVAPDTLRRIESHLLDTAWTVSTSEGDRCASVLAARGKYVTFVSDDQTNLSGVDDLIQSLERNDTQASRTGPDGVTVFRRWALVDSGTELEGNVPDTFAGCQDPELFVPSTFVVADRELRVVRQTPDEEGLVPAWLRDD